jgi:hypothetical protein
MSESVEKSSLLSRVVSQDHDVASALVRLAPIYLGVFLIFFIGITLGHFLPPGKFEYGPGLAQHMLSWDGAWYRYIAERGYHWNSAIGTLPKRYQNVAFFPLYPLIERASMAMLGTSGWITTILPGTIFGFWSIVSFDRLAQRVLGDKQAALRATSLYAFWPATCFYIMGYPTGLINLCAIEAIFAYIDKRFLRSALWCGLGTAAAPTIVFVAIGLYLDRSLQYMRSPKSWHKITELLVFGLLSVWGLVLFMVYLAWKFDNPVLFMVAQKAWDVPSYIIAHESITTHIVLVIVPILFFLPLYQTFDFILRIISTHYRLGNNLVRMTYDYLFQIDIDLLSVVLLIYCIFISYKNHEFRVLRYTASIILIGYIWFFCSTYVGFISGIRLLFPALIIFISVGKIDFKLSYWRLFLLISYILACVETALVWSGYVVI